MDHLEGANKRIHNPSPTDRHPLAGLFPSDLDEDNDSNEETTTLNNDNTTLFDAMVGAMQAANLDAASHVIIPIKVKAKRKTCVELAPLYQIQQLRAPRLPSTSDDGASDSSSIFAMQFSPDGYYLATGGADGIVRIWRLLVPEVLAHMSEDPEYRPPRIASIFAEEPVQVLHGHTGEVLDLAWSRNNFLLSASMDRTVRLWHHSRSDCLGVFPHGDFVTAVAFSPRDDRLFVSGSLDCRIRLWSIPERTVRGWNELPPENYVTAVAFAPSGKTVLAGSSKGVCLLFDLDSDALAFRYSTQIRVHSRRGKNSIGHKISGIQVMPGLTGRNEVILVSTNDSRIRAYTLRDKSIVCKWKGHANATSQIRASYSDDAEYIISGSEDGQVYVWNVGGAHRSGALLGLMRRSSERNDSFERISFYEAPQGGNLRSCNVPITVAIFAPSTVRNRLQSCGMRPLPQGDDDIAAGAAQNNLQGQFILAADLEGRVRVLECHAGYLPSWLEEGKQ